jgi:hypothetical protein
VSLPAVIPPASAVADVLALAGGPGLGPLRELLAGDLAGCVVVVAGAEEARGAVWGEILSTAAAEDAVLAALRDGSPLIDAYRDKKAVVDDLSVPDNSVPDNKGKQ